MKLIQRLKNNKGMTLVELMVVVAIFAVITTLTVFNYGDFRSKSSLQNLSDDIALSIRKAQGYAIGVRGLEVSSNSSFDFGYGIHFAMTTDPGPSYEASNKAFILFADVSNNDNPSIYNNDGSAICGEDLSSTNECLEIFNINGSALISGVYVYDSDNPSGYPIGSGVVDVSFKRPNPEARFCYRENSGDDTCSSSTGISHIRVEISSGVDDENIKKKNVYIYNTGQISVQ